jgi:CDP-diglyceride synthetase
MWSFFDNKNPLPEMLTRIMSALPMAAAAFTMSLQKSTFFILSSVTASISVYESLHLFYNKSTRATDSLSWFVCGFAVSWALFFLYCAMKIYDIEKVGYLFTIVWTTDTSCLIVGKLSNYLPQSGPRLLGWISKHKTISGCLGGIVCGTLSGFLYSNNIFESILVSIACICGDLLESAFKRYCGRKDSDVLFRIPGHGGLLDRVDSILLACPTLYLLHCLK